MATIKKTINPTTVNKMVADGMSKKEIANELGLLMGELNILGAQLNINWRTRKRKNLVFEFVDTDPTDAEGEEFVPELETTAVNI